MTGKPLSLYKSIVIGRLARGELSTEEAMVELDDISPRAAELHEVVQSATVGAALGGVMMGWLGAVALGVLAVVALVLGVRASNRLRLSRWEATEAQRSTLVPSSDG